jgi:hypothetical protein
MGEGVAEPVSFRFFARNLSRRRRSLSDRRKETSTRRPHPYNRITPTHHRRDSPRQHDKRHQPRANQARAPGTRSRRGRKPIHRGDIRQRRGPFGHRIRHRRFSRIQTNGGVLDLWIRQPIFAAACAANQLSRTKAGSRHFIRRGATRADDLHGIPF